MTSRPTTAAPITAVLAIVLVTLGAYVGGYFALSEGEDFDSSTGVIHAPDILERYYPQAWQPIIFRPAATVEGWLRGHEVSPRPSPTESEIQ